MPLTASAYAGTATTIAAGDHDWTDPAEAVGAPDGTPADVSLPVYPGPGYFAASSSYALVLGAYSLGLPAGATVAGVTVTARARATAGGPPTAVKLYGFLRLPDGTTAFAAIVHDVVSGAGTFADYVFGGPTDTWGLAGLTADIVNDADFRALLAAWNPSTGIIVALAVDAVQITVDYTPETPFDGATMHQETQDWTPPRRKFCFAN